MASNGAELRSKKAIAFLVGHVLLVVGFMFFTVGFATDHWLLDEEDRRFGLWTSCFDGECSFSYSNFPSWMVATQAMQTMALMCYMAGMLLAFFFHCASLTLADCSSLAGKARVLELSFATGCSFCLIGICVYRGEGGGKNNVLGYSYGLTVFSFFLNVIGTIMVTLTRNHINYNTNINTTNSVAPHGPSPTVVATTTSAQYPGPGRQHYPSGHGMQLGGGQSGGTQSPSYPYGTGGEGGPVSPHYVNPPPGSQQENLPYPFQPGRPLPMPEPGPTGGRGGDEGGSGPVPSGRLAPINPNLAPSAPPPSIDDGDQPPTYMEAVGGYDQR